MKGCGKGGGDVVAPTYSVDDSRFHFAFILIGGVLIAVVDGGKKVVWRTSGMSSKNHIQVLASRLVAIQPGLLPSLAGRARAERRQLGLDSPSGLCSCWWAEDPTPCLCRDSGTTLAFNTGCFGQNQ